VAKRYGDVQAVRRAPAGRARRARAGGRPAVTVSADRWRCRCFSGWRRPGSCRRRWRTWSGTPGRRRCTCRSPNLQMAWQSTFPTMVRERPRRRPAPGWGWMRERVALVGPGPSGGWTVRADLPLEGSWAFAAYWPTTSPWSGRASGRSSNGPTPCSRSATSHPVEGAPRARPRPGRRWGGGGGGGGGVLRPGAQCRRFAEGGPARPLWNHRPYPERAVSARIHSAGARSPRFSSEYYTPCYFLAVLDIARTAHLATNG